MNNLTILNQDIKIRDGLFSLNDLHKASGGAEHHRPSKFIRTEQTQSLITEIETENSQSPNMGFQEKAIKTIKGGKYAGTYGCKELVYAYAMWISAKFSLLVIRTFDKLANAEVAQPKLASPYIDDEQLQHIKTGVSKMVRATGKSFPTVYNELFDFVKAPSVRQIRKERYELACQFLGINPDFKVKADLVLLPKPKVDYIADIPFDVRKDADYTVQVRRGKVRKAKLMYCTDPQDEQQDWWLKI